MSYRERIAREGRLIEKSVAGMPFEEAPASRGILYQDVIIDGEIVVAISLAALPHRVARSCPIIEKKAGITSKQTKQL
jgi:hypothetical protein